MKKFSMMLAIAVLCALGSVSNAVAESKVTLTGMHLCCGKCVKGAEAAGKGIDAKLTIDKAAGSVTVTGTDANIQKALDALAAHGFHGKSDHEKLAQKNDVKALKGKKVKRLELTGVHICCGKCVKGIKGALAKVDGIEGDTVKNGAKAFVVEGDFDAGALLQAMYDAGYHASVK